MLIFYLTLRCARIAKQWQINIAIVQDKIHRHTHTLQLQIIVLYYYIYRCMTMTICFERLRPARCIGAPSPNQIAIPGKLDLINGIQFERVMLLLDGAF